MNPPTMYGEGSCSSWNPTGNRNPYEEDAFYLGVALREQCRKNGTHNAVAKDGYILYHCTNCGES